MKPKNMQLQLEIGVDLESFLDKDHALYRLANSLNWDYLISSFGPYYVENNGRPGVPIRVVAGLHYLKYLENESDESVVEKFCENPYWQYFCGFKTFQKAFEAEIQSAFTVLEGTPFESCLTHPLNKKTIPSIYSADNELLSIAAKTNFSESQARIGTVVSSNSFPAPKELFDKIKDKNPDSIDMETSAFYQVAWLLKIPSLAVRGISNVLNQNGIDDKIHQSDVPGSTRAAAIVLLAIIDTLILELVASETKELKSDVDIEVKKIITSLNLQPHPEGGSYACTYQSDLPRDFQTKVN